MVTTAPGDASWCQHQQNIHNIWVPSIYANVVLMGTKQYFVEFTLPVGPSGTFT